MWKAVSLTLPDVEVQGCNFHWNQAVYRYIQQLGLQRQFEQRDSYHRYMKKLMALPYLPAEHTEPAFHKLAEKATTEKLQELCDYIETTWLHSSIWPVESWSVFNRSIRTNNDVEGWHRRLNQRARDGSPPFYMLVPLLHQEATRVSIQARLLGEGKLKKHQRTKYKLLSGKVFQLGMITLKEAFQPVAY